ncbi:MAG: hypothetical protein H0T54_06080 [Geodermatophilaceae bacterium]|nr:hypothetical protein [Geodermatophilaceae bacterium]
MNPSPVRPPTYTEGGKAVQPLIYGYLRPRSDTPEKDAARAQQELTNYAEREGFTVAENFLEARDLPGAAFNGLIHAITRTETKDIVVPDLSHVGPRMRVKSETRMPPEAGPGTAQAETPTPSTRTAQPLKQLRSPIPSGAHAATGSDAGNKALEPAEPSPTTRSGCRL